MATRKLHVAGLARGEVDLGARLELAQRSGHPADRVADVDLPYARSHVKRETLTVLQRQGQISSPNQRRANSYPNRTLIDSA